ncbi:peroxisomal carnitine O-octanoyltransferase [Thalassophryne amazonica]|uniref:peroxisomal carnitine O-octanoyltransferase n=1 Tax=Thalassophryne amazonica TaxID=390379 RepID=UPI0014726814|nr:peroxisomal carnitine O-octanoyltransferase [Thalassophryne amazonica]XP_034030720.1 peroxisomal carnitine O-octanoyltransferase [Thalassophryne amazonica]XP_034030721.1 peroxisomal carnitine O-octanoyltransferase [Thalassophryne amazonica]XP_034030722.1 peroxisomal carnitine O-octanoyltransferase [Thalassophryne amazonica]XP_034030723.1 peroxisomal carnitine O-octanoyltransferase [Thalassophryne amazonica]
MANHLSEPLSERTFQYQNSLPPLPVPALESSLSKYLEAVCPFASEEEYRATVDIVKKFKDGIGRDLHQKLLHRAKTRRNWLEDWWLDSAYLEVRIPSQLNVNFGGPAPYLEHFWPPAEGTYLQRASIATWDTLQYWNLIRTEQLAPHKTGKEPLDMNQFRMLYCTCKVPGVKKDTIYNYFKTEREGLCPSHLVVMCRGRIFTFDALCDGQIVTSPELLRQLTYVKRCCDSEPDGDGVAVLTSEERTRWAEARDYLISIHPHNKTILETIQSSLFIISLDAAKPFSSSDNYTNMSVEALTGDATIRWGDKSYNMIVFADGTFASNCDHAPYDAMVLVSMCSYLDQQIKAREGKWKGSDTVRSMPLPEELVFTVDDKVRSDISDAKQRYRETTQDLQLVVYAFTDFGKAAIKQRKLHPDTFVQLAMQLAYYKKHGRPGCCYETATTRKFYHGRTETMRPCTQEAVNWCQAMMDSTRTVDAKRSAMLLAFNKHNKLMAEAQDGKGFDRHLLGLYLVAKEEGRPTPDLFMDPLYARSGGGGNFVLSTSLTGYSTVLGAVAPMVHHGYGFFYRIRDDRIVVAISAWKSCYHTDAESLFKILSSSLHEMLHLATTAQL